MMDPKTLIATGVGVLVSALLKAWPWLRKKWDKLHYKAAILFAFHVGGGLVIWLLSCKAGFKYPFDVQCSYQGAVDWGWTGTVAFASNQATYLVGDGVEKGVQAWQTSRKGPLKLIYGCRQWLRSTISRLSRGSGTT